MPRRRPAPPPDPARVSRALGTPPPRSRAHWVPDPPGPGGRAGRGERTGRDSPHPAGAAEDEIARLDADLRAARRPGLVTVPESIRRGRVAVSQTAVVAALALVVALGTAFAVRALWAERGADDLDATPADVVSPTAVVTPGGEGGAWTTDGPASVAAPGAPRPGGSTAQSTPAAIVVHVAGRVRHPGVVTLDGGARVVDAVTRAGGATSDADLSALNLARVLADGEQVYVPRPGESPPVPAVGGGGPASGAGAGTAAPTVVDLNAADASTLEGLPGVGPVLAGRIIDWRQAHGRFTSVDELTDVSGIGEKLFAELRPLVTV